MHVYSRDIVLSVAVHCSERLPVTFHCKYKTFLSPFTSSHIHNENSRIFAESIAQANKLSAEANARQHPYTQSSAGENVSESDMESDSESNGMISLGRLPRSRNLLQPPRLLTSEKSNNFRPANNHAVGGAFPRSENRNIRVNSPVTPGDCFF